MPEPRILLAEDEPVLARNIARSFARTGAEVLHAASAAETRAALQGGRFDLVIADISLGDGDGLEVIGEACAALARTPVIVMTGQDSVANRARAESLAAAAFLAKPFALSRLREIAAALTSDTGTGSAARPGHGDGPRVVMYSHDTIGLGHMRRNSAIAADLVRTIPGASVLMLVGCPAGMVFEPVPGVDYVKLPSLAKHARDRVHASALRVDTQTAIAIRRRIIEGVVEAIRPDLFLVDHEPAGAMDELRPVLDRLRQNPAVRTVLGLRDILDDPQRVRHKWIATGIDRLIGDAYDHVLVYGDPGFFPSVSAYGLERLKPGGVTQCGIVTRPAARPRGGLPRRPGRVLVSGGGGRDAYPLVEAAIEAARAIPAARRPEVTVVLGPLMDAELRAAAHALGAGAGIAVHDRVADMPALIGAADLLITMTGYNTINEALALGCPIVTVPRLGPSAEQRLRAEALEAMNLGCYLRREALCPEALARFMTRGPKALRRSRLNMDGVRNAAAALARLIGEARAAGAVAAPAGRAAPIAGGAHV